MSQQVVINGVEFAHRSDSLIGELPVATLPRLGDVLHEPAGTVKYSLHGTVGDLGESLLRLRIEGVVCLQCQRCMERFDHTLAIDNVFELLPGDVDLTQEEVEDDSRDHLPADEEIDVASLVEDEVILSLPVVPRHEDCSVPSQSATGKADSPFGVLAALKREIH